MSSDQSAAAETSPIQAISGRVCIRPESTGLIADMIKTIAELANAESQLNVPTSGRLDVRTRTARSKFIRRVAPSAEAASATIAAMADHPSAGLPDLGIVNDVVDGAEAPMLAYHGQATMQNMTLSHILRWVLNNASSEHAARYEYVVAGIENGRLRINGGKHVLVTREDTFVFDGSDECERKALEIMRQREDEAVADQSDAPGMTN